MAGPLHRAGAAEPAERELARARGRLAHFAEEHARYTAAVDAGDVSRAVVWASEAVDLIDDLPPAAEIVQRMVSEAGLALDRGLASCDDADR